MSLTGYRITGRVKKVLNGVIDYEVIGV